MATASHCAKWKQLRSSVVVCCQQLSNAVAALPAVIATALEMVVVAHKSSGRILKSVLGSDSDQKQKQKQQDREIYLS